MKEPEENTTAFGFTAGPGFIGGELGAHTQHDPCNCHDCTQARWKISMQYQIESAKGVTQMDIKADELRLAMETAAKKVNDSFEEFKRLDEKRIAVSAQVASDQTGYEEAVIAYAVHLGIPEYMLTKRRTQAKEAL